MKEQEVTLTEAELSDVKNSIAKLCKKYIAGSFFDKLVDSSGIKIAKDILMSDLKEMIGHGTSAPAAKKFANAVLMAKSTPAVDTILANYMLKGDGMGAGIGYTESVESTIKPFQEFLSEARKAEKIESKHSDELIAEAIKTVEAEGYKVNKIAEKSASHEVIPQDQIDEAIEVAKNHGYRVITQEQINEAKNIAEKNGYRVFTKEQIDEAKKIVESKGFRVVNEKDELNDIADLAREYAGEEPEPNEDVLYIKTYDYDAEEVADLINDALEDKAVPTYLRNIFKSGAKARKNYVFIDLGTYEEADEDETINNLISLVRSYLENAVGLEAEFSDELLDNYPSLFDKAYISNI
jgi:biotin operon repressor